MFWPRQQDLRTAREAEPLFLDRWELCARAVALAGIRDFQLIRALAHYTIDGYAGTSPQLRDFLHNYAQIVHLLRTQLERKKLPCTDTKDF